MPLFHYLALRAFAHETEDPERVRRALRHVARAETLAIEETKVDGSHGNRIAILEAQVKSTAAERAFFEAIARDDPRGFARLPEELERRVDEHLNLFLRLDKQEAFQGRLVVTSSEDAVTVRGKLRTFPKGDDPRHRALQEIREFLEKAGKAKA
jgi:RNA binding exosome subunit